MGLSQKINKNLNGAYSDLFLFWSNMRSLVLLPWPLERIVASNSEENAAESRLPSGNLEIMQQHIVAHTKFWNCSFLSILIYRLGLESRFRDSILLIIQTSKIWPKPRFVAETQVWCCETHIQTDAKLKKFWI